jgi:O-antigen ligase
VISIAFFVIALAGVLIFPMLIPFLLIGFVALEGIASNQFMHGFKFTVGGTNIFFIDLLYAASLLLLVFGLRRLISSGVRGSLTKLVILLIASYFLFFVFKAAFGLLDGVPKDTLVRQFATDTQCVFFFIPYLYLKNQKALVRLLYFTVVLSCLFPLAQPFLYGTQDQLALQAGQGGTLRLGSGGANILLMLGVLGIFTWEKKLALVVLPLAGMAMLAQRSAFIAIILSGFLIGVLKRRIGKTIGIFFVIGVLLVAALTIVQITTSIPVIDKATERLSQTFEKTNTTAARIDVIPMALGEFKKRPISGFSYRDIQALTIKQNEDAFSFNMMHPHNFVLTSLIRTGSIGTIFLFSIICVTFLATFRLTRYDLTRKQGMFLLSAIFFFVIFGLMNTTFFSMGYIFWTLAGTSFWYFEQVRKIRPSGPRLPA